MSEVTPTTPHLIPTREATAMLPDPVDRVKPVAVAGLAIKAARLKTRFIIKDTDKADE